MAEITRAPLFRHLRGLPTVHTLYYRRGRLVRSGVGQSFWFRPLTAAIAEVPVDDRELPFLFHGRTSDFADVTVQGTVTYRLIDPVTVGRRIDFTIDLARGTWLRTPLEQLAGLVTELAQQHAFDHLARTPLRAALVDGVDAIRARVRDGLLADERLAGMGVEVVSVRVAAVRPTPEVDKALQLPTREAIQQQADEATFARRALAVEKERAIGENELQTQIELARRTQQLVGQQGANERLRAEEAARSARIEAEGRAERQQIAAQAQAESTRLVKGAEVEAEAARLSAYAALDAMTLLGLAAQELAGALQHVDHLSITPELITPLLARLTAGRSDAAS